MYCLKSSLAIAVSEVSISRAIAFNAFLSSSVTSIFKRTFGDGIIYTDALVQFYAAQILESSYREGIRAESARIALPADR